MNKMVLRFVAGVCAPAWLLASTPLYAGEASVVSRIETTTSNTHYPTNKAPLTPSALVELPVGSIIPGGWLRHELELEASGMGGHLAEISPFLKFEDNGWVTANGKSGWEELSYWLKGYGDLGYVLRDERIMKDARRWIDGILAHQDADGWFGPQPLRTSLNGRPDMWPHMPILNALQSFYAFSGDKRILPFMTRYFKWQNTLPGNYFSKSWQDVRFGDNIESIYWLYNRTGDAWLLDLAKKIHDNSAKWDKGIASWHNVNLAQGFREPAEVWQQMKDPLLLAATERNYDTAMGTYGQFPGGGFAADENARPGYTGPRQGFETCGIVEFMHSFEMLYKITGDPLWADRCEYITFNSLPAAMTPDLKALHYLTAPNQIQLDRKNKHPDIANGGTMFSYSPYQVYRCCQHNHVMGWPYYAEHLWLATADDGLSATLYAASDVTAKVGSGDGTQVKIAETTDYPFSDTVQLKVSSPQEVKFPLYLRIPRWCDSPTVAVNGNDVPLTDAKPLSYIAINRPWKDGDTITLKLPMQVHVNTWKKNDNAVSVDLGPLSFSLKIGDKYSRYGGSDQWPELEVFPTTPWNYGLVLDAKDPASSFDIVRKPGPLADQPFTPETAPIELRVKAKQIPGWQADRLNVVGKLQPSPVRSDEPEKTVTLIPMGAARLRISTFPTIGTGPDARTWAQPSPTDIEASASWGNDDIDALNDGILPAKSSDQRVPRFTWWDHKGTSEWVQYTFKKRPRTLSSVDVYWFDDTGRGECRAPKSWRLMYRDGKQWKPVENASDYPVKLDTLNHVTFKPVETSAIRLEVQLPDGFSSGILEWRAH